MRALIVAVLAAVTLGAAAPAPYDVIVRGGTVYDGTGKPGVRADVFIRGERIVKIGTEAGAQARQVIDARGKAVTPGFINMLSQADDALMIDGRGLSDLKQGVTLEVLSEGNSMGPLTPAVKADLIASQGDLRYDVTWQTLGQFLDHLAGKGVSVNIASFVGASTVRANVLGFGDVDPSPEQLVEMRRLVVQAMQEGAVGVSSGLIYTPGTFAETDELTALATEAGRCGGFYASHMRSEGDRLLEAIDELIEISRRSGAPAEVYHLKAAGRDNWDKLPAAIARIEAARARGQRITADVYAYTAGSTGFDAAMPTWVQAGGTEAWIARLKDPATRARVLAEMRAEKSAYENLYRGAGPEGTILVGFKSERLKPLTGKRLSEVAKQRGTSAEDTIIDLVIEDGSRVQVVYFLMSEENTAREIALPWVSFGSDAAAIAPEGVFLRSSTHPRAYGNFARVLGKYVREENRLSLAEAVRKLTGLPAHNLGLHDRGLLKVGYFADVVVFDPKTIADHATFDAPRQYATGVSHVVVNGKVALDEGQVTASRPGQVVRGRGWTGWKDGGCRASAKAWSW